MPVSDIIFIISISTFLLLVIGIFIFLFVQLYSKRQLQFEAEKSRREMEFSQELHSAQLEMGEKVMDKLSVEIHDNIGQSIIAATLLVESANESNLKERNGTAVDILRQTLENLRDISKTMNGNYVLKEGLQKVIDRELQLISSSGKMATTFHGDTLEKVFHPKVEIVVFRCVQEALSNIIKHAQASEIDVHSSIQNGWATIEIHDNGSGFEEKWELKKGLGLQSLNRRINMLEGKFCVDSSAEIGTTIKFTIPLTNQNPDD